MTKEEKLNKIVEYNVEYLHELQAEGAWCGHVYATEYFGDLRSRLLYLIDELKIDCPKALDNTVVHVGFILETDYDALISKIYSSDMSHLDKIVIADALNDAFMKKMQQAFAELGYFYTQYSGKPYEPILEKAFES